MTDDPKCDACNLFESLKPCGFCGQPVVIRYKKNTGVHYISHEDWNSWCPQRPFYGSAEQWNTRFAEDTLRAENARLRAALQTVYDEFTYDADARRYITRNTLDQVEKALGEIGNGP